MAWNIVSRGVPAHVYYYNTDNKAREVIKTAVNSLYSWVQPDLPEDLWFIKKGNLWLIITSHELVSYIITEDKYEIEKIMQIESLNVELKPY